MVSLRHRNAAGGLAMSWKSTTTRYGGVAVTIHWLTALAVFALLISGFLAANSLDQAQKINLLRAHAALGSSVLLLTVLRIVWWWLFDRQPADAPAPAWQQRAAKIVHGLLYVVILVVAASGLAIMALSGAGNILFGATPPPLPDFREFLPRGPHGLGARLLLLLVAVHIGAALYHQFARRDRLLARMGLGR